MRGVKVTGYEKLYMFIGIPWLFLMIFTSRMFTEVKMALLGILTIMSFCEVVGDNLKLNVKHKNYVFFLVIYSFISLLWGILLGYDFDFINDFSLIQYYMITPICVLLFSTILGCKESRLTFLWKLMKYLTLALVVLDVAKVAFALLGQDPPFLSFIMLANENYTTKLQMRVSNEPSLMFLVPIYIYLFLNPDSTNKRDRFIYGVIVFFGIVYSILSGRKILEVIIVASFLGSMIFSQGKISFKRLFSSKILLFILLGIPIFLFLLSLVFDKIAASVGIENIYQLAYDTIANGLSTNADEGGDGAVKRLGNTGALINLWLQSPLWGNGLNSYAAESLASSTTKWSYEVVYIAWLAQTGIIGVYLLILSIVKLYKSLLLKGKRYSSNVFYALIVGFLSFIICGASNPLVYLVWPWSIILAFCYSPIINVRNRKVTKIWN